MVLERDYLPQRFTLHTRRAGCPHPAAAMKVIVMDLPERKHIRLKKYDYTEMGYYYITLCVKNRENLLSTIIPHIYNCFDSMVVLTQIGKIVDKYIKNINLVYNGVEIDKYIIMPNHIHMIISINTQIKNSDNFIPDLSTIVRSLKTMVTKSIGYSIWQPSFYEHIIRNEQDYKTKWKYINENPIKWGLDEMFQR